MRISLPALCILIACSAFAQEAGNITPPARNQWNARGEQPAILADSHSAHVQIIDDKDAHAPSELWEIYQSAPSDQADLQIFVSDNRHELLVIHKDGRKVVYVREGSTGKAWDSFVRVYVAQVQAKINQGAPIVRTALRTEDFATLKDRLFGKNAEAKLSLPIWVDQDGRMVFPPGKTAKPNELVTITGVFLCREYPAPATCGNVGNVMVVLLNGAQLRPQKPAEAMPPKSNSTDAAFAGLNSLRCALGSVLDCAIAQQDNRAIEQRQVSERSADLEAEQVRLEQERRYNEAGPEIAISLSSLGKNSEDTISNENILAALEKYITLKPE